MCDNDEDETLADCGEDYDLSGILPPEPVVLLESIELPDPSSESCLLSLQF